MQKLCVLFFSFSGEGCISFQEGGMRNEGLDAAGCISFCRRPVHGGWFWTGGRNMHYGWKRGSVRI